MCDFTFQYTDKKYTREWKGPGVVVIRLCEVDVLRAVTLVGSGEENQES